MRRKLIGNGERRLIEADGEGKSWRDGGGDGMMINK